MVSLHLKATMMKVSDPIIFGHAVRVFFKDAFEKHAAALEAVGANPNNGLGRPTTPRSASSTRPENAAIEATFAEQPTTAPRHGHGQLATRASPTCTSLPTSSSTRRCRRDPRLGQDVEQGRRPRGHDAIIPDRSYATCTRP